MKLYLPIAVSFLVLLVAGLNLYTSFDKNNTILGTNTTDHMGNEILFWEDVVRKHPTYRDGYLALANLYQQKNQPTQSQYALEVAKLIDPN